MSFAVVLQGPKVWRQVDWGTWLLIDSYCTQWKQCILGSAGPYSAALYSAWLSSNVFSRDSEIDSCIVLFTEVYLEAHPPAHMHAELPALLQHLSEEANVVHEEGSSLWLRMQSSQHTTSVAQTLDFNTKSCKMACLFFRGCQTPTYRPDPACIQSFAVVNGSYCSSRDASEVPSCSIQGSSLLVTSMWNSMCEAC